MFDRDPGNWNEGCGGGAGTWRRLAGRPARADLERRLAFLESADRQERDWVAVEETSRLAWRRAIRKWKDLGGATAGACQKARAFQVAGRKREDKERRAQMGARTYVTNGVWRVEGVRAQQRREQAERRGRARSAWLRQRRAAEVGQERGGDWRDDRRGRTWRGDLRSWSPQTGRSEIGCQWRRRVG